MIVELFGLLTRIRLTRRPLDLQKAAEAQSLFPMVGLVTGVAATLLALLLFWLFGKEMALVTGGLLLAALYGVTGILHTEGLADFADGMMASGTKEHKREVMKDVHVGAAGTFATAFFLIMFYATATLVMSSADRQVRASPFPWSVPFAFGLIVSEITGKLAMNVSIFIGPSSHEGMGSIFVRKSSVAKLSIAIAITCAVALTAGFMFLLVALGVVGAIAVAGISRRHFGGVSGDTFGAANEICRLATLVGWVLLA